MRGETMKKNILLIILMLAGTAGFLPAVLFSADSAVAEYRIGVDDVLSISVLRPEALTADAVVSPDGFISFPYIGNVFVKGMTLLQIQEEIQKQLSNGYMQYPVVAVALKESRSRKFFIYGEVARPGSYALEDNMTVFKAISVAGGLTKYGASSRVRILRPALDGADHQTIKVDVGDISKGKTEKDVAIQAGDVIVVSEGMI